MGMNNTNTIGRPVINLSQFNPHGGWNYYKVWRGEKFIQVWDELPGNVQRSVDWCHRNNVDLGIVSENGVAISLDAPRDLYYEFSRR